MKKILLILALLSLGVSKAQVVGGYLPVNSTKSATMGGLRVNGNETVTGTFSVGSTATITGGLKVVGSSTIGTGQNNYFGAIVSSQLESTSNGYIGNKLRVGNNTTPSATLDVAGTLGVSSTFSLGSANLTGGNTGTVAVLSDAVFPVLFTSSYNSACGVNMADATTYYWGTNGYCVNTSATTGSITLPYNCTLVGWDMGINIAAVPGTSETSTVSLTGTTSYTLSTTITFSSALQSFSATGLSQNFNSGDKLIPRILTPTWSTNPTQVFIGLTLWFVRRS